MKTLKFMMYSLSVALLLTACKKEDLNNSLSPLPQAKTQSGVDAGRVPPPPTYFCMGQLTNYLFLFANGSNDANWQGATKGFAGDVAINGLIAKERTSGSVAFAGKIYTNDNSMQSWGNILNQNTSQSSAVINASTQINTLSSNLNAAFAEINSRTPSFGFENVSSTSLNGLNTQNGIAQTFVINITSGLSVSSKINITGDAGDLFILRWDTDADPDNGYQGITKFQSGGAIVPHGGLIATNFVNVAGDISSSGGGNTPAAPYPQGPRVGNGLGALIQNGADFNGGGFFTGYWLTTGDPVTGKTHSLSNAIFVGGWYTTSTQFSMTSGTSGVYVAPAPVFNCAS